MSQDDKIMNLEMEIEIKDNTIDDLQKRIIELEKNVSDSKNPQLIQKRLTNSSNNDLVEDLQNALKTKEIQLKSIDGKNQVLKTDLTNLKEQIQNLRVDIHKKDTRILELENLKALENKTQNTPVNELVRDLQTKIKKQKAQIDKLKRESESLFEDKKETPQIKIKEIKEIPMGSNNDKIEELMKQNERLKDEIVSLKDEIKNTAANSKTPVSELVDDLQKKLKKVQSQNMKYSEDLEKYKHLEKAKEELEAKEVEIRGLKGKIGMLTKEISEKSEKIEKLNNEVEKLSSSDTESRWKELLDDKEKDISELSKNLQSLKTEIIQYRSRIEQLSTENKTMQQQLKNSDIAEIRKENLNILTENDIYKKKISSLEQRNQELEKEISESGSRQQMMRIREMKSLLESTKRRVKQQILDINDLRRKLSDSYI